MVVVWGGGGGLLHNYCCCCWVAATFQSTTSPPTDRVRLSAALLIKWKNTVLFVLFWVFFPFTPSFFISFDDIKNLGFM